MFDGWCGLVGYLVWMDGRERGDKREVTWGRDL